MAPTHGNGKICYLEIPSTDIARSAEFYSGAFGWQLRKHDDGTVAFDDGVGEVSGMWVLGRPPLATPGIVVSIMVADIHATISKLVALGGEIVRPVSVDAPEITAWFRDPAGNVMGLYQERSLGPR